MLCMLSAGSLVGEIPGLRDSGVDGVAVLRQQVLGLVEDSHAATLAPIHSGRSARQDEAVIGVVVGPTAVGFMIATGLQSVFLAFGAFAVVTAIVTALFAIETKQRILEEVSP